MAKKKDVTTLGRRDFLKLAAGGLAAFPFVRLLPHAAGAVQNTVPTRPNIILCMTDDQGWGDTSYNGHPILRTPVLDEMAANGIRFDRFYAAAPVCSPTRASVLTGRHPNRYGCFTHGRAIRKEEITIARVLKDAGYVTGHFGKWHLNGRSGPGRPISSDDLLHPGRVGFDYWFSVSNFFDLNPVFSRNGEIVQCKGDGSDVIVAEALKFISDAMKDSKPFLAVVWYGSPHAPHCALPADRAPYETKGQAQYYGEIAAVDRSMGRLRSELRKMGIAENTLIWFCSDNGGAAGPLSTGGLRGRKGTLWEGGIRVPGLLEWPAWIPRPFRTAIPCSSMDIYPTIVELLDLTVSNQVQPVDGISLVPLLKGAMRIRPKPIPFWWGAEAGRGHAVLIDNDFKLHLNPMSDRQGSLPEVLLYDLAKDPREAVDVAAQFPDRVTEMRKTLEAWQASVRRSLAGEDYARHNVQQI